MGGGIFSSSIGGGLAKARHAPHPRAQHDTRDDEAFRPWRAFRPGPQSSREGRETGRRDVSSAPRGRWRTGPPAMTPPAPAPALHYKRSHFATQLPLDYRYSAAHAWIARQDNQTWRVGLTRFATRMLGEIVDVGFEPAPGTPVQPGDVVGWIEGFKAISDLYCIARGRFAGANPELKQDIELVARDPYGRGWLYQVIGEPDPQCVDVYAYRDILDQTIDRLLAKQQSDNST